MFVSFNEIDSMTRKAFRGAGYHWGEAEDAGKAAVWLARRRFAALPAILALLEHGDGLARLRPVKAATSFSDAGGALCPVAAGIAMADRADQFRSREMLCFANLLSPLLLLPFAAVVMETSGCPVSLSWPSCEVVVGEGSCRCIESDGLTAPRASVEMRILDDVDLGASASLALALTADVDPEQWAALGRFAARTYVPASEQSRVSGAGAGLSDND